MQGGPCAAESNPKPLTLNPEPIAKAAYQPLRGAFDRHFALSEDGRLLTFASSEMLTKCKVGRVQLG